MNGQIAQMESCVKCARVMEASGHELNAGGDQVNEESWRQYIAQHGFGDAWDDSNHRTEQDRYGAIVAHLAASQEHRMAEQRDFVREKEQWTLLMRRSADCLERHRAAVEGIMELADKVQLEWAEKKALEDRHAQQRATCSNDWPRLFSEKKVRIGDWTDEDTKELTIVSTMFDPRYYLGHPGGDYIFRYSDEGDTTNLEAPCPMASTPETAWDTWESPEWDSILESDSEELPRRLQYCGQVPRPLQEYTGRLKVLVPAIAQIIVSLVGFHRANGESEPLSRELQELAGLDSTSSRADFNKLRLLWISEFPEEDGRAPTDIRGRLQRSAKVLEFAHLVTKIIADGVPTALEELASLLAVLKRSTGWRLSKMHRIECERVERRALHELLHEKEFEHLLVFEDPGFKVSDFDVVGGARWRESLERAFLYPNSIHHDSREKLGANSFLASSTTSTHSTVHGDSKPTLCIRVGATSAGTFPPSSSSRYSSGGSAGSKTSPSPRRPAL